MSGFASPPHAKVRPQGFSLRDEHITPKAWTEGLAAAVKCGLLEEGERARDLFVGVVGRAYRIARKPLAFVAGVLRKQLWRVVSDDDVREGWRRLRPSVPVVVEKPKPAPDTWEALKPKAANLGGILGNILAGLRPAALLDP